MPLTTKKQIKRPAGDSATETLAKKPAQAAKKTKKEFPTFDASPSPESKVDEQADMKLDESTITPQQRHVWKKALSLPEGVTGSVPAEVRESYQQASTPKLRNAVVNAFTDKSCSYGDKIKFSNATVMKFRKQFHVKTEKQTAQGLSYTALRSDLGHGDLKAGAQAIDEGLETGDIVKHNGLYYMKSHMMEEARSSESSSVVKATAKNVQNEDFDQLADALEGHSWAQFALMGERMRALPSTHKEAVTKPPSAEAMEHLETAVEKATRVCRDVRGTVLALSKILREGKMVGGGLNYQDAD